jgi:predicted lysophospholipase L1 biosynthesis ABC-type transport system permease subunit
MSPVYDDEETEDENGAGQTDASRRLVAATQDANQALEDAMQATLKTSRYLPWLLIVAAVSMVIAAAAIAYGVVAYLLHAPQSVP